MEWFYGDLAGIAPDPAGPGFKRIVIRPQPVWDATWVRAAYNSIHGQIRCEWQKRDGRFTLRLEVPENTTATVFVPARLPGSVRESGVPAAAPGVRRLREDKGRAVYEVGSSSYCFV